MRKSKRFIVIAIVALVVCTAVGASVMVLGQPPQEKTADVAAVSEARLPTAVTVMPATVRPVQRLVLAVGSMYGHEELSLSAKVDGPVRRILHDVGDTVLPGELLLEIDPTDAELTVAEAQKSLELELAKLGLKETPPSDFRVDSLPSVMRASTKEHLVNKKFERQKQLRIGNAISVEEFDQGEFEYQDAKQAHRQARLEVESTLAAVRQKQAMLMTARQRLIDTRVVAPGKTAHGQGLAASVAQGCSSIERPLRYLVAYRGVSEGENIRVGTAGIFKLVITDTLKLLVTVPERHFGEVKLGQAVAMSVDAYPQEKFAGKVVRITPTVDRSSRTFQVEIAVPNEDHRLTPGSFVRAEIQTRLDSNAITVPDEALIQFAGVTKVFVVRDQKAFQVAFEPTPTRIDVVDGGKNRIWAEVRGNLKPGDQVVVTGHTQLVDGASVKVRAHGSAQVDKGNKR